MCSRLQCPTCNHPTYAGCGKHVEQVLGDVPPADRCRCADQKGQPGHPLGPRSRLFPRSGTSPRG